MIIIVVLLQVLTYLADIIPLSHKEYIPNLLDFPKLLQYKLDLANNIHASNTYVLSGGNMSRLQI